PHASAATTPAIPDLPLRPPRGPRCGRGAPRGGPALEAPLPAVHAPAHGRRGRSDRAGAPASATRPYGRGPTSSQPSGDRPRLVRPRGDLGRARSRRVQTSGGGVLHGCGVRLITTSHPALRRTPPILLLRRLPSVGVEPALESHHGRLGELVTGGAGPGASVVGRSRARARGGGRPADHHRWVFTARGHVRQSVAALPVRHFRLEAIVRVGRAAAGPRSALGRP